MKKIKREKRRKKKSESVTENELDRGTLYIKNKQTKQGILIVRLLGKWTKINFKILYNLTSESVCYSHIILYH